MKKTLLSSMIIILMGLLGACSSNTAGTIGIGKRNGNPGRNRSPRHAW